MWEMGIWTQVPRFAERAFLTTGLPFPTAQVSQTLPALRHLFIYKEIKMLESRNTEPMRWKLQHKPDNLVQFLEPTWGGRRKHYKSFLRFTCCTTAHMCLRPHTDMHSANANNNNNNDNAFPWKEIQEYVQLNLHNINWFFFFYCSK